MTYRVLTLNNIAAAGLERLPRDRYEVASGLESPDAILVRSHDMHGMELPETLKAVARAGAGTNNIPVEALTGRGVPVFNAPGANANAVKELVLGGLFMASRNLIQAAEYVRRLEGNDAEIAKAVEAGKKQYVGFELPQRTLGVIGLGAIGVQVANAALALGMRVVGFDPDITVRRAWELSASVEQASSLDELFSRADFVTVHVPLTDATRGLVDARRIERMDPHGVLLNLSREGIVADDAVLAALDAGKLHAYVTDFPTNANRHHSKVIALPHLGASTAEAEENCAIMVAENLRRFLEHGEIVASVNFPEVVMPRTEGVRIGVSNANVPNMVGQITTALARANLNIVDLLNKSRGGVAYTLVDVDHPVPEETLAGIAAIEGVLSVRLIED